MPYLLTCGCGQQMTVTDAYMGKTGQCVKCGCSIHITKDRLVTISTAPRTLAPSGSGSHAGRGAQCGAASQNNEKLTRTSLMGYGSVVAGVTHNNADGSSRKEIIKQCEVGENLTLIREPDNPHDPNAVKICRATGEQIGYVERHLGLADKIAAHMDKGQPADARIAFLTSRGSEGREYTEVSISITTYEAQSHVTSGYSSFASPDEGSFPTDFTGDDFERWFEDQVVDKRVPLMVLYDYLTPKLSENIEDRIARAKLGAATRTVLNKMVERNLEGKKLEKAGLATEAAELYEMNVLDRFGGAHPYDRLRVIYTRFGNFDAAIRVCHCFLEVCDDDYPKHADFYAKFRRYLEKLIQKKQKMELARKELS